MRASKLIAVACLSSLLLSACDDATQVLNSPSDDTTDPASLGTENIYTTATSAGSFQTLTTALQVTGLDAVVADPDRNFTVFAPTDTAFEALGQETINSLLNDTEKLTDILLYHVIADATVEAAAALQLDGQSVAMANGDDVAVTVDGDRLFVNNAEVIIADVGASNGVIHAIDTVLLPPADSGQAAGNLVQVAQAAGSFNTLVAALQATGLDQTLAGDGPFTVFAPSDEAFAKLGEETINALLADPETLTEILLYHVISGQAVDATTAISLAGGSVESANGDNLALTLDDGKLLINTSQVTATDIAASNGVIHVIDTVLLPPAEITAGGTIVDVAKAQGFTTLVAALEAADLVTTLADTSRQFTVFAPTDAAFEALGHDTLSHLLADKARLSDVLLFHVLADTTVDSASVASLLHQPVKAANGGELVFSTRDHAVYVQHSKLIVTDVAASNGIIHVIDAVMIPPTH